MFERSLGITLPEEVQVIVKLSNAYVDENSIANKDDVSKEAYGHGTWRSAVRDMHTQYILCSQTYISNFLSARVSMRLEKGESSPEVIFYSQILELETHTTSTKNHTLGRLACGRHSK